MTAIATPTTGHYEVEGVAYIVEPATRGVRILRVTPTGKTFPVGGARHDGTTYITATGTTTRHHVEALLADAEAALTAETVHCTRCHRELTGPESIARGYGAECTAKAA